MRRRAATLDVSRSGHPQIVAALRTAGGQPLPPLFLGLNPRARPFLEQNLTALGIALPPGGRVIVHARALVGRCLPVRVEHDREGILRSRAA
jgi:hypothetical protein